jgi:hypothetical protein
MLWTIGTGTAVFPWTHYVGLRPPEHTYLETYIMKEFFKGERPQVISLGTEYCWRASMEVRFSGDFIFKLLIQFQAIVIIVSRQKTLM